MKKYLFTSILLLSVIMTWGKIGGGGNYLLGSGVSIPKIVGTDGSATNSYPGAHLSLGYDIELWFSSYFALGWEHNFSWTQRGGKSSIVGIPSTIRFNYLDADFIPEILIGIPTGYSNYLSIPIGAGVVGNFCVNSRVDKFYQRFDVALRFQGGIRYHFQFFSIGVKAFWDRNFIPIYKINRGEGQGENLYTHRTLGLALTLGMGQRGFTL